MSIHPLRRKFKPDVDELISAQAVNPLDKYIVNSLSLGSQKMDALCETVIAVEEQTTKTNGRVQQHDKDFIAHKSRLEALEAIARRQQADDDATHRYRRRVIACIVIVAPFLSAIFEAILHFFWR